MASSGLQTQYEDLALPKHGDLVLKQRELEHQERTEQRELEHKEWTEQRELEHKRERNRERGSWFDMEQRDMAFEQHT
jgi:hypothetical protein